MCIRDRSQQRSQSGHQSKQTLSVAQREELKIMLIDKFSKLYKNVPKEQIKNRVLHFIDTSPRLKAEELQKLENEIKQLASTYSQKSKEQASVRQEENQSVRSGVSKMSGASNYRLADDKQKTSNNRDGARDNASQISSSTYSRQKSDGFPDLNFNDEEEQWAVINKYNAYQHKQEQKLNKIKDKELKNRAKSDLDEQINQKKTVERKRKRRIEYVQQHDEPSI
eukprot:TRINITY_DN1616_c0_g1_i5.p1 TRINITY_DN1616_c0_g1~~TRINITY_DN1616_c0_g1_i5.p1  ORF type:complete len:224 (+),score=19.64 TRINITY_DN1616_c0_g1_i5:64-735(+)